MKYKLALILVLAVFHGGLLAQNLAKFPALNKVWNGSDYLAVYDSLKADREASRPIPSIHDKAFRPFYDRLLAFENLNLFIDDSKTFEERALLVQPYFQAFPQFLQLYSEANMNDEAISITRLLLEATKRSAVLYELKFKDMSDADMTRVRTSLQDPIFNIGNGSLKLLEENPTKTKNEFLIALAAWLNDNFISLYPYLSDRGKGLVKEKINSLAKTHPDKTIKKLMTKLDKKLK